MKVVTVLRSGGVYNVHWLHALRIGLEEFIPNLRLSVLTDLRPSGYDILPIQRVAWKKWWAKMHLFDPGLTNGEPFWYMDLDTLPVGDSVLRMGQRYVGTFAGISGFHHSKKLQSGVMYIDPSSDLVQHIWKEWEDQWIGLMNQFHGDGDVIAHLAPTADRLDKLFPGVIQSFKVHHRHAEPDGSTGLVCGHGEPRFNDPKAGWAHELWMRRLSLISLVA